MIAKITSGQSTSKLIAYLYDAKWSAPEVLRGLTPEPMSWVASSQMPGTAR